MRNAYCFFYVFLVKYIEIFRKMKNKNKHLGYNDFEKNNDLALFESKFVYMTQKHHLHNYEESTADEDKLSAAEGVISKFNESFNPETEIPNSGNSIASVVHGVRHSLMQGPLSPLNAPAIATERIRSRLEWARINAPEIYKKTIDDLARAEIDQNPTVMGRIWNTLTFRRSRVESKVAEKIYTFNIEADENYETLINDVEGELAALGNLSINGVSVNFGDPNEVTTFPIIRGKHVIINWYKDNYDLIKRNLERANAWEPFMDLPEGRKFMILKSRHSLLTRYNNEERAKLTTERYKTSRLNIWLDIETSKEAMQDEEYLDWIRSNASKLDKFDNVADLQSKNPALYDELQNKQQEAEQRVERNALKGMLKDILKPNLLDQLEDSHEMKALLAYIQSEYKDDLEGPRVKEFIRRLAGRSGSVDDLTEINTTWNDAQKTISTVIADFDTKYGQYTSLANSISEKQKHLKIASDASRGGPEVGTISKEISGLKEQQLQLRPGLIDPIWKFLKLVKNEAEDKNSSIHDIIKKLNEAETTIGILGNDSTKYKLLNHKHLLSRPSKPQQADQFLRAFSNIYSQREFQVNLDDLNKTIKEQQEESKSQLNNAKKYEGGTETQTMDARGLLHKLVERDIKARGVSSERDLQTQTWFATNALIAQSKHSRMHGNTNELVAKTLESSTFGRWFRNRVDRFIPQGWLPVLSAKEILGHVVANKPKLQMLSRINVFSTRKDLMKAIKRYGSVSTEDLRELQEELALFIQGVDVPTDNETIGTAVRKTGEKISDTLNIQDHMGPAKRKSVFSKKYRVRSDEAPMLENIIHTISLLESQLAAERSLANIGVEIKDKVANGEEVNRSQLYLEHLEEQTEASQATDNSIVDLLENEHSPLKKRLLFKRLKEGYYQAMEETRGMPGDERNAELTKMGYPPEIRAKGLFSLRARWWTKEIGKGAVTLPFKALYGGLVGAKKGVSWAYKSLYGADTWKRSSEATKEQWKSIFRFPFTIAGSVLVNYPAKILSVVPRWLDRTAVKSTDKSYAAINQEVVTNK